MQFLVQESGNDEELQRSLGRKVAQLIGRCGISVPSDFRVRNVGSADDLSVLSPNNLSLGFPEAVALVNGWHAVTFRGKFCLSLSRVGGEGTSFMAITLPSCEWAMP